MYKTIFKVEVLSEEPLGEVTLADLHYQITEGHCSGVFTEESVTPLTPAQMAEALIAQGSDPEFFGLDAKGNKIEE